MRSSRIAFGALLLRDLVVLRKHLREFIPRTIVQPLLLCFVFLYVFPTIGTGVGGRGGAAGESANDLVAVEIARDVPHRAVRVEMPAVERRDARSFLAAVLQRVQPEGNKARSIVGTPDTEHAAFFPKLVVVERIGRQHAGSRARGVGSPHIG